MFNIYIKIDEYIKGANEFAIPILSHIRKLVHETCSEVEEKIRWGFPHFDYKVIFLSKAAFKSHCVITFWKRGLLEDKYNLINAKTDKAKISRLHTTIEWLAEGKTGNWEYIKK